MLYLLTAVPALLSLAGAVLYSFAAMETRDPYYMGIAGICLLVAVPTALLADKFDPRNARRSCRFWRDAKGVIHRID